MLTLERGGGFDRLPFFPDCPWLTQSSKDCRFPNREVMASFNTLALSLLIEVDMVSFGTFKGEGVEDEGTFVTALPCSAGTVGRDEFTCVVSSVLACFCGEVGCRDEDNVEGSGWSDGSVRRPFIVHIEPASSSEEGCVWDDKQPCAS